MSLMSDDEIDGWWRSRELEARDPHTDPTARILVPCDACGYPYPKSHRVCPNCRHNPCRSCGDNG